MCPGDNPASKKWVPGIPLGVKAAGAWGWRPTTLVVPNVKKSGALAYSDPLGPSRRPVVGDTFTFTFNNYIFECYPDLDRLIVEVSRSYTIRHNAIGIYHLYDASTRRRERYLTTHNIYERQTAMLPVEYEPIIPASELPQT